VAPILRIETKPFVHASKRQMVHTDPEMRFIKAHLNLEGQTIKFHQRNQRAINNQGLPSMTLPLSSSNSKSATNILPPITLKETLPNGFQALIKGPLMESLGTKRSTKTLLIKQRLLLPTIGSSSSESIVTPSFSSSFRVSLPHFNDNSSSITQPEKEQRKQKLKTKQEKPRIRKKKQRNTRPGQEKTHNFTSKVQRDLRGRLKRNVFALIDYILTC